MLPRHITFTGVDEHTDLSRLAALSQRYPIEWGVLFSPSRQGGGRYPALDWLRSEMLGEAPEAVRFAAHLCGGHARDVLERGLVNGGGLQNLVRTYFDRVQINSTEYPARLLGALQFCDHVMCPPPILQCRGGFPDNPAVSWLCDQSGGRGKAPSAWPQPPSGGALHGYAGGIGPANVAAVVAGISANGAGAYWIDMESGVRDADDRFDLGRVETVCRAVYGDR